jgi:hypothetical protein
VKSVEHQTTCPFCEDVLPLASGIVESGHDRPKPGDLSFCMECGNVSIFDTVPGGARKPVGKEQREIDTHPELQGVLQSWRMHRRGRQ